MGARWTVAVTDPMDPIAEARLARFADRVLLAGAGDRRKALLAGADALIVRTPVSEDDITAGERLRLIVRHGVGLDFIPVALALRRGIQVANVPDASSTSVAEHVIGALLALARGFLSLDRHLRAGDWAIRQRLQGVELSSLTLGVVGLGRIGQLVAMKARDGLGMRVIGLDPKVQRFPEGVERASDLNSLLAQSDAVTLHLPLTDQTRNLIDGPQLRRMKPRGFLINAARGGIVNEQALLQALESGHLAGAAVDVFEGQPVSSGHPLLRAPNVLLTPHTASLTAASFRAMGEGAVAEIERAWREEPLLNPVTRAQA